MDTYERLKKLKELLDSGIITKDEFDEKKGQILSQTENVENSDKTENVENSDKKENVENSDKIVLRGEINNTISKNKARVSLGMLVLGIGLVLVSIFKAWTKYKTGSCKTEYFSYVYQKYFYNTEKYKDAYHSFFSFFKSQFFNLKYGYLFLIGLVIAIVAVFLGKKKRRCEITVTNDRVYGIDFSGNSYDIPIDQVYSISVRSNRVIEVSSTRGINKITCIENAEEIVDTFMGLHG